MDKKMLWGAAAIIIVSGISVGLLLNNLSIENQNGEGPSKPQEPYVCSADAKMCPDGSYVGRTGPNCEFTVCPMSTTSATVRTTLGQVMTGLNVSITPKEIISDSRCPIDVVCIWAGTVEVRTTLSTPTGNGELVLKLGEPQVFGDYIVTLVEVTPSKKTSVNIPISSYRFTFEVRRK
jgi:hypothetical protein